VSLLTHFRGHECRLATSFDTFHRPLSAVIHGILSLIKRSPRQRCRFGEYAAENPEEEEEEEEEKEEKRCEFLDLSSPALKQEAAPRFRVSRQSELVSIATHSGFFGNKREPCTHCLKSCAFSLVIALKRCLMV
jgi:hypothetical protein